MAGEQVLLDPTAEDAANVQIDITAGNYTLIEADYTPSANERQMASSATTEGERQAGLKPTNRTVAAKVDCRTKTALRDLEHKLTKWDREGGTYKRILDDATSIVFDVVAVKSYNAPADHTFVFGGVATVTFEIECLPYGRGASVTKSLRSETTLPALIFTETAIPGDVPALGKLVVTDAQAVDQFAVIWGMRSRYYDAAATAGLFYQAKTRTMLGGSTSSGASTSGSLDGTIARNAAVTFDYQAVLSTQTASGSAHLTHVGAYRVWARVWIEVGTADTDFALEWATGDFRAKTRNPSVVLDQLADSGTWRLIDLGEVNLPKVAQGAQRWEGRIVARKVMPASTSLAALEIDWLMLQPITEGSGIASGVSDTSTPTAFGARDEFSQTAGNLTGKTLPVGGTWTFQTGDTDDYTVDATPNTVKRATTSDTAARIVSAGTTAYGTVAGQVDVRTSALDLDMTFGMVARYSSSTRYATVSLASVSAGGEAQYARVQLLVRNTSTRLLRTVHVPGDFTANAWYTLRWYIDAAGRIFVWAFPTGGQPTAPVIVASDPGTAGSPDLASTGQVGLYDANLGATAAAREYDNFRVWTPTSDAALFASQSLEVRHDRVIREDSTGVLWTDVSKYEGDYLRVPCAGRENRTVQFIVKGSRNAPTAMADPATDDINAQLTVTPRWWETPE